MEAKIKVDRYKTFYLLQTAEDKGLDCAEFELGRCYHLGKGTNNNQSQAIKWMTKATGKGNPEYQYRLEKCYAYLFERNNGNSNLMDEMAAKYLSKFGRII